MPRLLLELVKLFLNVLELHCRLLVQDQGMLGFLVDRSGFLKGVVSLIHECRHRTDVDRPLLEEVVEAFVPDYVEIPVLLLGLFHLFQYAGLEVSDLNRLGRSLCLCAFRYLYSLECVKLLKDCDREVTPDFPVTVFLSHLLHGNLPALLVKNFPLAGFRWLCMFFLLDC